MLSLIIVLAIWLPVIFFFGMDSIVFNIFGVYTIPVVILASGFAASFWKTLFQMGLKDWKGSSFAFKLLPLIYSGVILWGISFIQQTYVTAVFASALLGVASAYIGRLIESVRRG